VYHTFQKGEEWRLGMERKGEWRLGIESGKVENVEGRRMERNGEWIGKLDIRE